MPDLGPDKKITITDPVCGKVLCIGQVVAEEDYGGWAYFFCSHACRKRFLSDPKRYATIGIQLASGADKDRP